MVTITIVRVDGVSVYIDSEDEHCRIGHAQNDPDAFSEAIDNLEQAVAVLRTSLANAA